MLQKVDESYIGEVIGDFKERKDRIQKDIRDMYSMLRNKNQLKIDAIESASYLSGMDSTIEKKSRDMDSTLWVYQKLLKEQQTSISSYITRLVNEMCIRDRSTTDLRMTGFTETLDKLGSDIKVLGVNNNDNMKDLAIEVMQDFITQFGDDIDGVYAMEDYGALGAQIALKEAGYTPEDVVVIGVGGSAEGLQAVKDGLIYGTTLQAPSIDCAQTAELVQKIIDGEIKPPVQLDPYFNYMELPKITAENVEQYLPGEW